MGRDVGMVLKNDANVFEHERHAGWLVHRLHLEGRLAHIPGDQVGAGGLDYVPAAHNTEGTIQASDQYTGVRPIGRPSSCPFRVGP